jgi:hypothetical protein
MNSVSSWGCSVCHLFIETGARMPLVRCRGNAVQDPVLVARPQVGQQDHANAFRELQIAQEHGHPQSVRRGDFPVQSRRQLNQFACRRDQ